MENPKITSTLLVLTELLVRDTGTPSGTPLGT
jgi:hypothetical protein